MVEITGDMLEMIEAWAEPGFKTDRTAGQRPTAIFYGETLVYFITMPDWALTFREGR